MSNRWAPLCVAAIAAIVWIAGCAKKEDAEPAETLATSNETVTITSPVGYVWKWEGTQTPVERLTPSDPTQYTLEFLPDTSVVAKIDCNTGRGKYKMDGSSIAIGPLATTRMACPPGSLGGKFAQQLEAARTIFFRGDTLFMDLFADSGTMKFSQMPEPEAR